MKLFLLCLFAGLIAAANSLECYCTPDAKGCASGVCQTDKTGSCISGNYTFIQGTEKDAKPSPVDFQGCANSTGTSDVCKEGGVLFTFGKNFSLNSLCCKTKNCNSATPAENTTLTRKVCPTCFALSSNSCNGTKKNCTGSQDYCLTISGTIVADAKAKNETFFGQGCATYAAQILKKDSSLTFGGLSISITSSHLEKAKDGASCLPGNITFALLLPCLLGLLLDKFLY